MSLDMTTNESKWLYVVAGIAAILFGALALVYPGLTVGLFVIFFGVFVIVDGVIALIDMFRRIGSHRTWWPQLIIGLIGIAAGLYVLANPVAAAAILVWVIAFWALFVGMMEIFASFATGQLVLLVVGLLTVIFGFIVLANPVHSVVALVMVIGIFYIVRGITLIFHAFSMPSTTPTAV